MPRHALEGARLAWRSADRIWRLAGDEATDFNHYSKRGLLIGVYASTTFIFLDDQSDGLADTRAFLDRRIGDVMRFEKAKARWQGNGRFRPSLSRFLGRLRAKLRRPADSVRARELGSSLGTRLLGKSVHSNVCDLSFGSLSASDRDQGSLANRRG